MFVRGAVHASAAGLGPELSRDYVCMVENGFVSLKPGWARVNFNYFISQRGVPLYRRRREPGRALRPPAAAALRAGPDVGQWRHGTASRTCPCGSRDLRYASGKLEYPSRHVQLPESVLEAQLEAATRILADAQRRDAAPRGTWTSSREGQYERLRWFAMPEEVAHDLQQVAPQ